MKIAEFLDELEHVNDLLVDGYAGEAAVQLGKLLDKAYSEGLVVTTTVKLVPPA